MKLSHSKLSTILSCPMTYYLGYVQGIKKKVEKTALAIGSAVHWGIEHDTEDLTEYFNDNGSFRQENNLSKEQLLAEAMVHGYRKHKDELFMNLLSDPVTGEQLELVDELHETYLTGKLKSFREKELTHDFVGIIDLLLLTNKGFILVDYKTSTYIPDWDNYLDQLYRYIFELKSNFPDTPIVKIAIINIRKAGIRQKKNETEFEFLQRLKFEYDINDENYVNYHEFLPSALNQDHINNYIDNLAKMADTAHMIDKNKMWYINYGAADGQYGKSEYWDIFYHTPGAEALYNISDYIWSEDEQQFVKTRDCVEIDMKVIEHDNVLNKYSIFKQELLDTSSQSKEEFFRELAENYFVDRNLLDIYWQTYIKEQKEVKNAGQPQNSTE